MPESPSSASPIAIERSPKVHLLGFFFAFALSLLLHAVVLGAVIYWDDWFGAQDGDHVVQLQTIVVLGNEGGAVGNVKGHPESASAPTPSSPITAVKVTRTVTPKPTPPLVTVDDVKRTVYEAQQWLARTTPQLRAYLPTGVKIDLPSVPTELVADAWKHAATLAAEQLPKLTTSTPKKVYAAPTPTPEPPPALALKQEPLQKQEPKLDQQESQQTITPPVATAPTPETVPKQETVLNPPALTSTGNAASDGNQRNGAGNVGAGGNNDGEDARLRLHACNIAPPYPPAAARFNVEGTVYVRIEYSADGTVTRVSLESSSGSALLDDPVVDHVRRYWHTVHPRTVRGRPVEGWHIAPFVFRFK